MIKKMIAIVVIVAALWAGTAYFNSGERATDSKNNQKSNQVEELPRISFKAPAFNLQSLSGKTFSIADAKGKPLVINFWNSWCSPCKEETPELVKLYSQYKDQFQLYGVNITSNDTLGAIKAFVRDFDINYPVLLDQSGDVSKLYRVQAIPTSYFIDENGIIVDKAIGFPGSDVIIKKIKKIISE